MTLEDQLALHSPADEEEAEDLGRIRAFVSSHPHPFDRTIHEGHLTASALVVSSDGERVLLLHHAKLQRWLQPGGHGEPGETGGEDIALREALEETGIEGLVLDGTAPRPLDVDIHDIPARGNEPAHEHLDLRYLVLAPEGALFTRCTTETRDMAWVTWDETAALGPDRGLVRALRKARHHVQGKGISGSAPTSCTRAS